MKITISILKFLFLGALFIVSNENLHLNEVQERTEFYGLFYSWLETLFNHSMQIVGYVTDSEWLPQENPQGPFEEIT
ncbi:MAG: hypothetical protein KJ718_00930 [Nanoarchaeota archaeon]|nr:hypothetical protein [Nanoarchaeota archaeon]MBU1051101.1 hypothetical protein [Nanoarchaeota archaeon]MBU1987957.1 hypothetical protein [Nanoarchaeota archaeon]